MAIPMEPVAFVSVDGTFEPFLDMLPHAVIVHLMAEPEEEETEGWSFLYERSETVG